MKVTIVSHSGYANGITHFLSSEGHNTAYYTSPQGVVQTDFTSADIALFDSPTLQVPAEWCRARGIRVLGPSAWSNLVDSNLSYRDNLITAIGYKKWAGEVGTGEQVGCLFNGQRFISKFLVCNYTKMMAGDVGCDVESSGYVAYFKVDSSPLVNNTLAPLEKFLRKANHRGFFSIDTISNETGTYVKNICANFWQPFAQAVFENTRRSKSDILLDTFNESSATISPLDPYVCGVMISVYPYPANIPTLGSPVLGIDRFSMKHMWLVDILKGSGDAWSCGKESGCLGYVMARGVSVEEARRRAYRTVSNIKIDGIQFRNDIGKDANERLFRLRELKLL